MTTIQERLAVLEIQMKYIRTLLHIILVSVVGQAGLQFIPMLLAILL